MTFIEAGFFPTSPNLPPTNLLEEKDKPNTECGDFRVNISKEDLSASLVKDWVLEWCIKYHPEALEEAEKFIKENLDKQLKL